MTDTIRMSFDYHPPTTEDYALAAAMPAHHRGYVPGAKAELAFCHRGWLAVARRAHESGRLPLALAAAESVATCKIVATIIATVN